MIKYFLFIFVFINSWAFANVYMHTDKHGNTVYSDAPSSNATLLDVSGPMINVADSSKNKVEETVSVTSSTENKKLPYTQFNLINPTNDQTFQNQPVVSVDIHIEPNLQSGDTMQLFMDNNPYSTRQTSTHFELDHVDRGTHQLYVVLFDEKLNILKQTKTITVYIHYAHLGPKPKPIGPLPIPPT